MDKPAEILRRERERLLLTQRELAQRSGVSQSAISRYEHGDAVLGWDAFRTLLAGMGQQPRIELAQLDADVDDRIDAVLSEPDATSLIAFGPDRQLIDDVRATFAHRFEGLAAARLCGAPVPVDVIDMTGLVTDDVWEPLARVVRLHFMMSVHPQSQAWTSPTGPCTLREWAREAGDVLHLCTITGTTLRVRLVDELGSVVMISVGGSDYPVVPLLDLHLSDPDHRRLLDRARERAGNADRPPQHPASRSTRNTLPPASLARSGSLQPRSASAEKSRG
ncbi:MAG: helix-turn-helix domain-containing protein [Actinomycetota bacterium]|nr:helix-turn-helix domain-containing protein [Actinomycetota bacterium]